MNKKGEINEAGAIFNTWWQLLTLNEKTRVYWQYHNKEMQNMSNKEEIEEIKEQIEEQEER